MADPIGVVGDALRAPHAPATAAEAIRLLTALFYGALLVACYVGGLGRLLSARRRRWRAVGG